MNEMDANKVIPLQSKVCFKCGEQLTIQADKHDELLCESCEHSAELSQSHYYMMQYYYKYAD